MGICLYDHEIYKIEVTEITGRYINDFFQQYREENLTIVDDKGYYIGFLTYYALLDHANCVDDAINSEYVYLDINVWRNALAYFVKKKSKYLPVLDASNNVICYCFYHSKDMGDIVDFEEYRNAAEGSIRFAGRLQGVQLFGCSELMVAIWKLMRKYHIPVRVYGLGWNPWENESEHETYTSRWLNVFADDSGSVKMLKQYMSFEEESLQEKEERGEKICNCWVEKEYKRGIDDYLWGIYNETVMNYVDVNWESANLAPIGQCWIVDTKEKYYFLRYYGISKRKIRLLDASWDLDKEQYIWNRIVNDKRDIILMGNRLLCKDIERRLTQEGCKNVIQYKSVNDIAAYEAGSKICVIAEPMTMVQIGDESEAQRLVKKIKPYFKERIYLELNEMYCWIYERELEKRDCTLWKKWNIQSVVLGWSKGYSGNFFLDELLDGHPEILSIPHSIFSSQLWYFAHEMASYGNRQVERLFECYKRQLSECKSDEFNEVFPDYVQFAEALENKIMKERPESDIDYFMLVHVAYHEMIYGHYDCGIRRIIFWEPHRVRSDDKLRYFTGWFQTRVEEVKVLNIVRDPIKACASRIKDLILHDLISYINFEVFERESREVENCGDRLYCVRFEDLKQNPREQLGKICEWLGITWNESLMKTTYQGKSSSYDNGKYIVKDFDLRPVFNRYEEYFDEFDHYRLELLYSKVRKKYGYGEIDVHRFSWSEIENLFASPFKFERNLNDKEHAVRREIQRQCSAILYRTYWE